MRKIRDLLRLRLGEGLSLRQVSSSLGVPLMTVSDHLHRAERAGLSWPLPVELDDDGLEARLFPPAVVPSRPRAVPEWAKVHVELRRAHVTLMLLWLEYREDFPDGYGYSQFCELYRRWARHVDVVMRQEHKAGEKLFVDFAGDRIAVWDEPHWRAGHGGRAVRGGAGGQQLHLRRGVPLPGADVLGGRARARLGMAGGLPPDRGLRQSALRGDPPAPLRA